MILFLSIALVIAVTLVACESAMSSDDEDPLSSLTIIATTSPNIRENVVIDVY